MSDEPKPELAPKAEWIASYGGFPIYIDPNLAPGWVQFRNAKGEIIGMINGVGEVRVASSRPPSQS